MGARVCPFCNFEQEMARAQDAERATISLANVPPTPPSSIPPPSRPWWSTRVFVVTGAVLLLVSAFAVGALVNVIGSGGWGAESENNDPPATTDKSKISATASSDPSLGDLRLVPADDPSVGGQIITSAPVADPDEQLPAEYQRSDATALPSEQYARILKTTKAAATPTGAVVDPRSVSGGLMEQARREEERRRREARQSELEKKQPNQDENGTSETVRKTNPEPEETRATEKVRRTNPVPVYQPLPRMDRIRRDGTFRFALEVGRDGLVKEVRVIESIPGMTPRMIAAVQQWKFKPATRNGEPVDGTFEVDISMKATE